MTAKAFLKTVAAEIGVTEWPKNSNNVKYNTWYYGHEVSGSDYPWCMAFVQWCFDRAGHRLPYKTASCSALLDWYKQNQPGRVVKSPKPGDIAIYNFHHTGIVESATSTTITAIEGNTSSDGTGSQSNGGGVFRRTRSVSTVVAYIRAVDFESETATASTAPRDAYTCIVAKGDTLSKIAATHNTTSATLAKLNGIKDPNIISVGQKLYLTAPGKLAALGVIDSPDYWESVIASGQVKYLDELLLKVAARL